MVLESAAAWRRTALSSVRMLTGAVSLPLVTITLTKFFAIFSPLFSIQTVNVPTHFWLGREKEMSCCSRVYGAKSIGTSPLLPVVM